MKALKYFLSALFVSVLVWSCEDEEFGSTDFVDGIAAPTNVSAAVRVTQDNTGLVTITPIATGAASYTIDFGDNSTVASVTTGNSAVHTYTEGTYTAIVTAKSLNGITTAITQEVVVSFKTPENLVVTIENDPAISKKVNLSAAADYATSFEVYFGASADETPVEFNVEETVSYQYQEAGTYTIRLVAMSAALETVEEFVVTAILQPLTAAPTPSKAQSDVLSVFSDVYVNPDPIDYNPNWGQSTTFTEIAVDGDNIIQYGDLTYQGIDFNTAAINASGMEFIHVDVWTADDNFAAKISPISSGPNEAAYDLELNVNQWTSFDIPISYFTTANPAMDFADIIQFKLDGVASGEGSIFIDNLYFYKSAIFAETPNFNAPDPTYNSSDVISIFSDSYTNVGISELNPDWGQTTTLTETAISGNNIWLYESLNYTGIVTNYDNPTDLSGMNYVHFDYYTPDASILGLKLVNTDLGEEDIAFVAEVVKGAWISVTIPLDNYTLDLSAVSQLIFDTTGGSAKVYIDNLYFYSENGTEPAVSVSQPTIDSGEVISVFSDSYVSVGISELNPDWGQTTTLTETNISGNNLWLYESLNYTGIVTNYDSPTDLSSVAYVHFDYWTPDATILGLKLVNTVAGEEAVSFTEPIITGTWVSVTISLADYDIDLSAVTQLLFDTNGGSATVYIDNLYFHN